MGKNHGTNRKRSYHARDRNRKNRNKLKKRWDWWGVTRQMIHSFWTGNVKTWSEARK